jgi:hypothetical protein
MWHPPFVRVAPPCLTLVNSELIHMPGSIYRTTETAPRLMRPDRDFGIVRRANHTPDWYGLSVIGSATPR